METRGKCVLCGIKGQGRKDFICENCGDPERIFILCQMCGNRHEMSVEELTLLSVGLGILLPCPPRLGMILEFESCPKEGGYSGDPTIYVLKTA